MVEAWQSHFRNNLSGYLPPLVLSQVQVQRPHDLCGHNRLTKKQGRVSSCQLLSQMVQICKG